MGVLFLSSSFFLGGPQDYEELRENLILNIVGRVLFFALPGVVLFLILIWLNTIAKQYRPYKIAITGLIYCFVSSFVGSLIFFFH